MAQKAGDHDAPESYMLRGSVVDEELNVKIMLSAPHICTTGLDCKRPQTNPAVVPCSSAELRGSQYGTTQTPQSEGT